MCRYINAINGYWVSEISKSVGRAQTVLAPSTLQSQLGVGSIHHCFTVSVKTAHVPA